MRFSSLSADVQSLITQYGPMAQGVVTGGAALLGGKTSQGTTSATTGSVGPASLNIVGPTQVPPGGATADVTAADVTPPIVLFTLAGIMGFIVWKMLKGGSKGHARGASLRRAPHRHVQGRRALRRARR